MRIAVLTNAYPPEAHGGAGQIAFLQAEALRAKGHEIRVWQGSLAWTKRSCLVRFFYHLRDHIAVHPSTAEIQAWKPDRLLTHNLTGVGFRTSAVLQVSGIPWIHVLHDVQLFVPSGRLTSWMPVTLFQRFCACLRHIVMGDPQVVISPTEILLTAHRTRGFFRTSKMCVIPNPAPTSQILPRTRHAPLRVAFVGRWAEDKGSALLESLWHDPCLSSIEWHLIGPDTERAHPPQGRTYGFSSTEFILNVFDDMDLLVVPSQIMENQPTVLLEAFSRGLPVIASHQSGIVETLGEAGTVCDSHDRQAWKSALLACMNESDSAYQDRIRLMIARGIRYEPEQVIQRVEEVLVTLN